MGQEMEPLEQALAISFDGEKVDVYKISEDSKPGRQTIWPIHDRADQIDLRGVFGPDFEAFISPLTARVDFSEGRMVMYFPFARRK